MVGAVVELAADTASLHGPVQEVLGQKLGLLLAQCILLGSTEIAACRPSDCCCLYVLVTSLLTWKKAPAHAWPAWWFLTS